MALDPALAGLLGALVGGGATFAGSIFGNRQQARHDRKRRAEERKVEAYSNSLRSLLQASYAVDRSDSPEWEKDLGDAQYWLTVLATACGARYREDILTAARQLFVAAQSFLHDEPTDMTEVLLSSYWVVTEAARQDIGFVG